MIEKQDRYFAEDIDDKYFIIHEYSGETVKPISPYPKIYSSENPEDVVEPDEIPEIEIKLVMRKEVEDRFTDFAVLKEVDKYKYLVAKDNLNGTDRVMIMQWYGIDSAEYREYLDEPLDSFFERFRIRS